jgi:hypothetical protein
MRREMRVMRALTGRLGCAEEGYCLGYVKGAAEKVATSLPVRGSPVSLICRSTSCALLVSGSPGRECSVPGPQRWSHQLEGREGQGRHGRLGEGKMIMV